MARTIVGLYDTREAADTTVRALKEAGFDNDRISVVSQDGDTATNAAEGAGIGAASGGVLGGTLGLLVGLGALAIPGIGPVVAAGPLGAALLGAGVGAASGGLLGALTGLGLTNEDASAYAEGVRRGGTLVTIESDDGRIDEAVAVMNGNGAVNIDSRRAMWANDGWDGFDPDAPFYERTQVAPVVPLPVGTVVGPQVVPATPLVDEATIPPPGADGLTSVDERAINNPDDAARLAR
jgi:hypothetical protein